MIHYQLWHWRWSWVIPCNFQLSAVTWCSFWSLLSSLGTNFAISHVQISDTINCMDLPNILWSHKHHGLFSYDLQQLTLSLLWCFLVLCLLIVVLNTHHLNRLLSILKVFLSQKMFTLMCIFVANASTSMWWVLQQYFKF